MAEPTRRNFLRIGYSRSFTRLMPSPSASSTNLAWSSTDLAGTSIDAEGSSGPSQVTLSASNGFSGTFKLTLNNLVPGQTSDTVLSISYQPASGPDSWLCNASSPVPCTYNVTLTDYDGVTLAGTFSISFPEDGFGVSASLTSGSFIVTLE